MSPADPILAVRAALEQRGCDPHGPQHAFRARCPGHDGENRDALSVTEGADRRVLLWCHAHRCEPERIVAAIGLAMSDLFAPGHRRARRGHPPKQVAALGQQDDLEDARRELEELLALPSVGLRLTGGRIIGDGADAQVILALSDGSELVFRSLMDMAKPQNVNARVVATTGARPKLDVPGALDAVALVRQYATTVRTMSETDDAIEWGVAFLREAALIDVDLDHQGDRWGNFHALAEIDPRRLHRETGQSIASASRVLRHRDGSRLVSADWFRAYVRSIEPRITPAQLAIVMQRVGWVRRGREGRWKATEPNGPGQLNRAFWLVPAGWDDRGEEPARLAAVTAGDVSPPAPVRVRVEAVTGRNREGLAG